MRTEETFVSFQEYFLEESFKDSILDKWEELKSLLTQDDSKPPVNKRKAATIQQEIYTKLKELKQSNSELFKKLLKMIVLDPVTKFAFKEGNKAQALRFITVTVLHLIALGGMMAFHSIKDERRIADGTLATPAQYSEIVNAIQSETPPSPKIKQKSQQVTDKLVQEVRWGNFDKRRDLVIQIKKFESDSGKPLAAYFDRTQTSIGFGTKARKGESNITPEEAHNRLIDELEENEKYVHNIIDSVKPKWKLTQNQWNALIDISFNVGSGNLTKMLKNSKNLKDLGSQISNITHATKDDGTKVKSPNLIARRAWENKLLGNK